MRKNILLLLSFLMVIHFCSFAAFNLKGDSKGVTEETSQPSIASIKDGMNEFKSLSKHERKAKIKEAKKALKQYKLDKKEGAEVSTNTLLLVIIAILIPPLAVYLHQGKINDKFWIALLLTLLFYVPGLIYALIVIFNND